MRGQVSAKELVNRILPLRTETEHGEPVEYGRPAAAEEGAWDQKLRQNHEQGPQSQQCHDHLVRQHAWHDVDYRVEPLQRRISPVALPRGHECDGHLSKELVHGEGHPLGRYGRILDSEAAGFGVVVVWVTSACRDAHGPAIGGDVRAKPAVAR